MLTEKLRGDIAQTLLAISTVADSAKRRKEAEKALKAFDKGVYDLAIECFKAIMADEETSEEATEEKSLDTYEFELTMYIREMELAKAEANKTA